MKSLFLVILLSFSSLLTYAQRPAAGSMPKIGVVIGRVMDDDIKKPVEYASVSILKAEDNSVVAGTVTESNGYFKVTEVPMGEFIAVISFIGYENYTSEKFSINRSNSEIGLGNIAFKAAIETLDEVEVIEQKPMMEVVLDKRVFDASQIAAAQGGSATDVLENIPSVEVDMNGNLSLRGNDNVRILIDGKPSALAGADPATVLRSIPADAIKDIEVITNPSARYDPDGMTGIINIVLKKNKWVGMNGSVNAGIGNYGRYNGGFNLNYRDSKVNVFTNFNYRHFTFPFNIDHQRYTTSNGGDTLLQETKSERAFENISGKLGFDYYLNPYNTITVSGMINGGGGNSGERQSSYYSSAQETDSYSRTTDGISDRTGYDFNLNHTKTFAKKGRELISDLRYSTGKDDGHEDFAQIYTSQDSSIMERSNTAGVNSNFIAQIDYINPLGEDKQMEIGLKAIDSKQDYFYLFERENDITPGMWEKLNSISSDYFYSEQNYSAYAIYAAPIKSLTYQLGVRAEQTYFLLQDEGTEDVERNYFSLFPTAHISKDIGEKSQAQLSYSRRINRPGARQLSPNVDYGDPLNLRQGNPNLRPEYVDAYELGFNRQFGKSSIQSSVYYRKQNDIIRRFRDYNDSTGVAILTYENFESSTAIGVELIGSFRNDKWSIMPSLNGFSNTIVAGDSRLGLDASNYALNAKIMLGYNFSKNLSVQASSRYRSSIITTQGFFKPGVGLDLSTRYSFADRKGNLSLSVQNVFNSMRFSAETRLPGYVQFTDFVRPGPMVNLNFSYTFGKQNFSFKRRRTNILDQNNGGSEPDMM